MGGSPPAVLAGQDVYDDTSANQVQVNEATAAITDAIASLVPAVQPVDCLGEWSTVIAQPPILRCPCPARIITSWKLLQIQQPEFMWLVAIRLAPSPLIGLYLKSAALVRGFRGG